MKPTTPFQCLCFALLRKWVWIKQNPLIFIVSFVNCHLLASYIVTSAVVIVLFTLSVIPSCRKVHPETFWNEAYQRGYAEKVYLPNGQPAYRWKEGSDNGK